MEKTGGLEHVRKLLRDNVIPELKGDIADIPLLGEIHNEIKVIRETLLSFSAGDFSPVIKIRGIIPGCLKALQSHLQHLIWQVRLVEKGDFSQEVHFMGEFSTAFNNMVRQLNKTLQELKQKEETLMALTDTLRNEIHNRNTVVEALQESEARLKYLASHDPLTGTFNRLSFIEMASAELKNAAKAGLRCCMAIMDIDHFKRFNDTYGHVAGDEALRHIVRVLSGGLRKGDFLGRYGGEEFTIFFFNSDKEAGAAIVERLRKALASSPVLLENQAVQVTASFGVAEAEGDTGEKEYVQKLVTNADIALYSAKKHGRNRVMLYDSLMAKEFQERAEKNCARCPMDEETPGVLSPGVQDKSAGADP
ncbi:MAG: GGDEF domain-containing protein [Treponema sp.]|jgi:diguanylate cyclase (GGDEF)-like protein|nr:GGDEF domain-containing protein [Treponema sp.]